MIISQLVGGLGNQMFQYAIGRYFSIKNNTPLLIDKTLIEHSNIFNPSNTIRDYELSVFKNIEVDFFFENQTILKKIDRELFFKMYYKIYRRYFLYINGAKIIQEKKYTHENLLKLNGNYYLEGYFQKAFFANQIRTQLLNDFEFPHPSNRETLQWLNRIQHSNAVSIHIRRGDFLEPKNHKDHSVLGMDYYQKAIKYLTSFDAKKKYVFYVFSDDIDWCKQNVRINGFNYFFVNQKTKNDFEDMRLMSKCKHHILANSSFSWWSSWLNQNDDKIIIAPKNWLTDKSFHII